MRLTQVGYHGVSGLLFDVFAGVCHPEAAVWPVEGVEVSTLVAIGVDQIGGVDDDSVENPIALDFVDSA